MTPIEFNGLPWSDKVALLDFAKQHRTDIPYLYPYELDSFINYYEAEICAELGQISRTIEEQERTQVEEEYLQRQVCFLDTLSKKYPGRYRFFFATVYVVIKEAEDGITFEELKEYLLSIEGASRREMIVSNLHELYWYDEYKEANGKIYYDKRSMTKGKAWCAGWKRIFNEEKNWTLELALTIPML